MKRARYNRIKTQLNVWAVYDTDASAFGPGPLLLRPGTEIRNVTRDAQGAWCFEARRRSEHIAQSFDWTSVRTSNTCDLVEFLDAPVKSRGRRSLGARGKYFTVGVPLTEAQFDRLTKSARGHGVSLAEFVREVLVCANEI